MPSREIVEAFAKRLEDGDFVGAIEHFYAPDAATYENNAAPTQDTPKTATYDELKAELASNSGCVALVGSPFAPEPWPPPLGLMFAVRTAAGFTYISCDVSMMPA